jgi:hypothetical protein
VQPGKKLARDAERRVFGGRGDEGQFAGLKERKEKILLRLGVAVQFVQDQDFLVLDLLAQGGDAHFRGADADKGFACVLGQEQGHGGLAAAGGAEEQEARQILGLHQGAQTLAEMALADEVVQGFRAQGFGERAFLGHDVVSG